LYLNAVVHTHGVHKFEVVQVQISNYKSIQMLSLPISSHNFKFFFQECLKLKTMCSTSNPHAKGFEIVGFKGGETFYGMLMKYSLRQRVW
jgi:hypothetical protein